MTTFEQLCADAKCTPEERGVLARYLALRRYEATLQIERHCAERGDFGLGASSNAGRAGGDAHGKSSPAEAVINSPDQLRFLLKQEIDAHTGRLAGTHQKGPDFEAGFIQGLRHVKDNLLPLINPESLTAE